MLHRGESSAQKGGFFADRSLKSWASMGKEASSQTGHLKL